MKKYIYLLVILLAGMFYACDYNEHYFDDFEEKTKPENNAQYEYTFQSTDVTIIVNALKANKTAADTIMADAFNKAKVFSNTLPADKLIPYLLKSKYVAGDVGSTAMITYNFKESSSSATVAKTDQFVFADVNGLKQWVFDPTISTKWEQADYQFLVDYVRDHQSLANPALYNSKYKNEEYFYGANAFRKYLNYADQVRTVDTDYPIKGTKAEKEALCNKRAIEAVQLFLAEKYPNATPTVSGVAQQAKVTIKIYSSHLRSELNEEWVYTMQCTGSKEWKFVKRTSLFDNTVEENK